MHWNSRGLLVVFVVLSIVHLAVTRFRNDIIAFPVPGVLIMTTYLLTQYLIATRSARV